MKSRCCIVAFCYNTNEKLVFKCHLLPLRLPRPLPNQLVHPVDKTGQTGDIIQLYRHIQCSAHTGRK